MKVTAFEAGAVTGLLVAGATWLGARINSTSQAKREQEAREAERRQVFEQETLVALQDALEELYRIVEEKVLERFPLGIHADQVVDLPYPAEPLVYRTAAATVDKLRERVLDDDLRALTHDVLFAAVKVLAAVTRRAVDNLQEKLWDLSIDMNQRVGERLRRLFEP